MTMRERLIQAVLAEFVGGSSGLDDMARSIAESHVDAVLRELAEPDDGMIEAMREEIDFHDLVGDDLAIRQATRAFIAAIKSISA